jgi:hypothetical protein
MAFFDRPPSELTPFPAVAFASSAVARTFSRRSTRGSRSYF